MSGWSVLDLSEKFPPVEDDLGSSIQAKYVKFLAFLQDFPGLSEYSGFFYTDHKCPTDEKTVEKMLGFVGSGKLVVIRKHPEFRDNVMQEVSEAMSQERYRREMPTTLAWLKQQQEAGKKMRVRVSHTGIIFWTNSAVALRIAGEMYSTILRLQQPECQVIWPVVTQPWRRNIRMLSYNSLGIQPKNHPSAVVIYLDRLLRPLRLYRNHLKSR